MIFDEYFDRVVIITLDPLGDRARRTRAELGQRALSENAVIAQGWDGEEVSPPTWFQASRGAWGCLRSHVRVMEDALRDGAQRLLILEDDCIWLPDAARRATEFLGEMPEDWGQIYFGGQLRPRFPIEALEAKTACFQARSVHRTHAYAVSLATMPRLLAHVQHAPDYIRAANRRNGKRRHIDHQLEVAHRRGDWPVYVPASWLAGQAANYSTVRSREEAERWWQVPPKRAERYAPLILVDETPSPEQMRKLHFGYNLSKGDPTIDLDVERAATQRELVRTLRIVAEEALTHRRLPAIHGWAEKREMLGNHWPAGVIELTDGLDLEVLVQSISYPHPHLARRRTDRKAEDIR